MINKPLVAGLGVVAGGLALINTIWGIAKDVLEYKAQDRTMQKQAAYLATAQNMISKGYVYDSKKHEWVEDKKNTKTE